MKLVMTLRTREQADIVDAILAFHLNAGVDFVIATDHRSTDGTVEILESYARQGHLALIREQGEEVRGAEWRTRMARLAATEHSVDWVFSADGDEFWWPRGGELKELLAAAPHRFGVVSAPVRHFVPVFAGPHFFAERMTVRLSAAAPLNDPVGPFRPFLKVANRAHPKVMVSRGNHSVSAPGLLPAAGWHPLEVLHFPLRSPAQAEQKYLTWHRALGQRTRGDYAKAALRHREGTIAEHLAAVAVDDETVARGLADGSLVRDTRLLDVLRTLGFVRSEPPPGARVPLPPVADAAAYTSELAVLAEAETVRLRRALDELDARLTARQRAVRRGLTAKVLRYARRP